MLEPKEIQQYLRDNLSITTYTDWATDYSGREVLVIQLTLEQEVISESRFELPHNDP